MKDILLDLLKYHSIDKILSAKNGADMNELLEACRGILNNAEYGTEDLLDDLSKMRDSKELGYLAPLGWDTEKKRVQYTDPAYSLSKVSLNRQEKDILRYCMLYLEVLKEHKNLSGLKGMIQKLSDTLQIRSGSHDLEPPDFVNSELPPHFGGSQFIGSIISAIEEKKVVRLYYLPFYEDKPYFVNVHPYLLKEYRGRWYLIGLNDTKNEIRTYGLDRIWEMELTSHPFTERNFSAADYFRNTVGIISPVGPPPEIHIEVSSHQAKYLITQPLHESQFIEKEDPDFVVFSYRVHPTYEFKSMLLAMGKEVRVLKPDSFRKEMIRELNDAILGYGR